MSVGRHGDSSDPTLRMIANEFAIAEGARKERERMRPKLGPGDAVYILAWCAWRQAEIQGYADWDEAEACQRFVRWWNDSGGVLLDDYGYRLLDTVGAVDPQHTNSDGDQGHPDAPSRGRYEAS